jgi:hypothetical protein
MSFLYMLYGFVVVQPLAKRDDRRYEAAELSERENAGVVKLEASSLSDGGVPEKNVKRVAIYPTITSCIGDGSGLSISITNIV